MFTIHNDWWVGGGSSTISSEKLWFCVGGRYCMVPSTGLMMLIGHCKQLRVSKTATLGIPHLSELVDCALCS